MDPNGGGEGVTGSNLHETRKEVGYFTTEQVTKNGGKVYKGFVLKERGPYLEKRVLRAKIKKKGSPLKGCAKREKEGIG